MLCFLAASLTASTADAAVIRWRAPAGCPDAVTATETIMSRVPAGGEIAIEADVRREREGFVADVALAGAWGTTQRRLESPDCNTLVDAIALLAAVSVDPVDTATAVAAEVRAVRVQEPLPEPARVEVVGPSTEPSVRRRRLAIEPAPLERPRGPIGFATRLDGIAGFGSLPRADLGVGVTASLVARRARLEVGANYLAPSETRLTETAQVGGRIDAWSVAVRGCPVFTLLPRLTLPLCGGIEAGQMRGIGTGPGLQSAVRFAAPWVAATAGAGLHVEFTAHLGLHLGADAVVPLVRPGFAIRGVGEVYRTRQAAGRGSLGLEVRFR